MKLCTLAAVTFVVILTLDVLGHCEGWWGSRSSSRSSSSGRRSSSSRTSNTRSGNQIKHGKTGIRDRDETGHRTGLGTLGKKLIKQPIKTIQAGWEFAKSYGKMRKENKIGGNLPAHQEANREATKKSDAETAAAFSALREQYKRHRDKTNPDGTRHIGDTRTQEEIDAVMDANKQGREDAKNKKETP